MSKSSIKTKTVLTMTDMTESTELLALKRQKDGYKVTVKFRCIFVLFYREMNSKSGKIYLLATIKYTWCASLPPPFTGISHYSSLRNLTWHSYLVYLWFYKLFQWSSYAPPHFSRIINLLHIIILVTWQAWHIQIQRWIDLRITKRWGFFPLLISIKTFQEVLYSEN